VAVGSTVGGGGSRMKRLQTEQQGEMWQVGARERAVCVGQMTR
jgi:hypothetical protein